MKAEYIALKKLEDTDGYKILHELWMMEVAKIETARDRAAARGAESHWRYHAGLEKGFKMAMTQVARAIAQMEQENYELAVDNKVDTLLAEIRGEPK